MSTLLVRQAAIISLAVAADYSAKQGYLVTHDGTTATVSASATVPASGVILEPGKDSTSKATIGIIGAFDGTCYMRAGGVIAAGARVQQGADGRVLTDAGPGTARVVVGVALEAAAAANDLIEVAPLAPMILP